MTAVANADARRLEVAAIAASAIGRGSEVCQSAAPGVPLKPAAGGKDWCQIFWLWCLREAGLTELTWSGVARKGWTAGWLGAPTKSPKPGDMAYKAEPFQHGAPVIDVRRDAGGRVTIVTADGNSTGGVVVRHERPIEWWDAFYSIGSLLAAPAVPALAPPPPIVPARPAAPALGYRDDGGQTPAHRLQRALHAAGRPCGNVDGKPGAKTTAELMAWALAHPDRIV